MFVELDLFGQECFLTVQPNLMPTDSHQIYIYIHYVISLFKQAVADPGFFRWGAHPQGRGIKQLPPNMTLQ